MQRKPFNKAAYSRAKARSLRRAQLWHASRLACPDPDTWRAAWPQIGDGIEAILRREFPAL